MCMCMNELNIYIFGKNFHFDLTHFFTTIAMENIQHSWKKAYVGGVKVTNEKLKFSSRIINKKLNLAVLLN